MLEFKNVNISVGRTSILKDISVGFEKGKITAIIGPNGCGKTTLLQTLNGVSLVTSGKILIDGDDYLGLRPRERAKRLSFMPQFREGSPGISVKGLVEHGRFPYMGFGRKMGEEDKEAVKRALIFTALTNQQQCYVNELSGGMQQRAYLAMQLAQNSEYMVLDEPMNYLDFPGQRDMFRLIKELNKAGKTIILVLHDLGEALKIADNLVIMKERKIVGTGSPSECLERGVLSEVFECAINEVIINGTRQYVII